MGKIKSLSARKILNSRCEWTIEVEINGFRASAPSGASKGSHEVNTIPPDKAVKKVNSDLQNFIGKNIGRVDDELEPEKIGGNTSTAISFAAYNALHDKRKGNIFPYPLSNIFGGGSHGGSTSIQEFLVLPKRAKTFPEALELVRRAYKRLESDLKKSGKFTGRNDESALAGSLSDDKALDTVSDVCEGLDIDMGLDMAASELWNGKKYVYRNGSLNKGGQLEFVRDLIKKYNVSYVEDPFHEGDFGSFQNLKKDKVLVCGDDLVVTDPERMKRAVGKINSVIIKPNQVGTVKKARETVDLANRNGIIPVMSHRSGETTDTTISKLVMDWKIPIIKAGAAGLRTAKLNELLRLWEKSNNPRMNIF